MRIFTIRSLSDTAGCTLIDRKCASWLRSEFRPFERNLTCGNRPLRINRLLDGYDTVLEVGDPDFKVGDAFTDSEKTEFVPKFTVKVVQEPVHKPAQSPLQRFDSIPPDSSARPRKRSLGGIAYHARSSMRDFMRPADVERQDRPVGYADSNKRQRIGFQEGSGRDDPDRPMLSRERDFGEILSQQSLGDRNESVVRLVQDSQQSPFNNGRNRKKFFVFMPII